MRILVVEDEIRLAQNVASAFRERAGYAVDLCHDGEGALPLCKTATYDLIVLDLMQAMLKPRMARFEYKASSIRVPSSPCSLG